MGKPYTRREFLGTTLTGILGVISGCGGSSDTEEQNTTSPTAIPTSTPARTVVDTASPTPTPDSSAPIIETAGASYSEPGKILLELAGEDPGGLSRAEISIIGESGNSIERDLGGTSRVDLEAELADEHGDPRVAEIHFLLEDLTGNRVDTERGACITGGQFAERLRKDLDPMTYRGDPYLGVTEPEPVDEDGDLYIFWRNTDDEIALSRSPDRRKLQDIGVVASREGANGLYPNYVISPTHIEIDGTHYLFFEGNDGQEHESRIGVSIAPSIEGPYTMHDEPVLTWFGDGAEEVLVGTPAVEAYNDDIFLFYHGWDAEHDRTSVARATDFPFEWEKSPANPILDVEPGTWYSNKIAPSDTLQRGDELYVLVEGDDGGHWRTGIARTKNPFDGVELVDYNPVLDLGESGSFDDKHAHVPGAVIMDERVADTTVEWLHLFYQGNDGAAYRMGRASQPLSCTR